MSEVHPQVRMVFEYLHPYRVALVGSAVRDYASAGDLDFLVVPDDWGAVMRHTGLRYSGWDQATGAATNHIRRTTFRLDSRGVEKFIQLLSHSTVVKFEDWPHALQLPDGAVLNPGAFFNKRVPVRRWIPKDYIR